MKRGLVLLGALLMLAAAPSASVAQKAKGGPDLVFDGVSQIFVPFQSVGAAAQPAKAAKKAKRSKKARKSRKTKKKS